MEATPQKESKQIQSRVGKRPVDVPKGITVAIKDGAIKVEGPKGKLSRALPAGVDVKVDGPKISVTSSLGGRDASRMQGLVRALIAGMVKGAAEGYTRTLELKGTGYRAEVKGTTLNMALGFSHPINFPIPAGIKCEVPGDSKGTIVNLSGADKELMGQTAATIRGFRPPEPYAGKGVRYQGEKVREKAGKAGKGGKGGK
ncbi:MAG TPA: 50S ribosomal protein L6 [Polyangiaceae bacterium]|nr:50S ribosomal protein L6 [Polyangiaceae bacterium]